MAKVVEIKGMELDVVEFTIIGTSPLIVHNWDEKAKRQMLDKQMGKASKAKHDVKIPVNDFMGSLYWLTQKPEPGKDDADAESIWHKAIEDGAAFGFPIGGIKQSIITGAARTGLDVKMTELRSAFFLRGTGDLSTSDMARIEGSIPEMREDMVRLSGPSAAADIRHRAMFETWSIPLSITYNKNGKYSLEQLLNCVNAGGFGTGIGEWRPEKNGQFGMYQLKTN